MFCTKNLFLYFLIFLFGVHACLAQSTEIVVDCTHNSFELKQRFPAKFFVETIDIQADFRVDQDELLYLIDLVPKSHVTIADLEQTVLYLQKKEYFSKIELEFDSQQHKLIFKLEGHFVLSYVKLHGSLIGKEKYKHSYVVEVGECFNEKKHIYSLKKMKELFFQSGCFNAHIRDELVYDQVTKTVKVDLFLQKGHQFSIGNCSFDMDHAVTISQEDRKLIAQKLQHLFIKRFFSIKYNKEVIEKSIHQLQLFLTQQGFSQVTITYDQVIDYQNHQVDLQFHLSFNEKKEIVFWGNHFFTKENFLENILMYGKSSWRFPGAILSDEIETMYKSKGFFDSKVSVKQEPGKAFCMIDEGKRAVISRVEIKDNFTISSKDLEQSCFAVLYDKPFDREVFAQSIASLKRMYKEQGFWDIAVIKEDIIKIGELDPRNMINYKIVLTLDEGQVRTLRSIDIVGHQELLQNPIFTQCLSDKKPINFNYYWIARQKLFLTNHFKDLGHTHVSVDYQLIPGADGFGLVWNVHLDEQQVYFGKFVIRGNSQIPFKYLQRELLVEQGQIWDKKKIETSLANLRNLELFDTVHLYSDQQIDEQGQMPVHIKLVQADRYEVKARVGCQQVGKDFSLQQGFSYKVGSTAIINNPFKFGDRAIVEADFTKFYENFSLQYLMPWLFKRPIRSQFKIYDNHYLQPLFIGSDVSIYNAFQQGILFGLQEKHENINVGMSVGLEFKGIDKANISDIAISIDYNPGLFAKKFAYLLVQPSLMWTNVDNVVNPQSGSNALISVIGMADMQNQTSLFKLLGEYALYVPLAQRIVFAVRTRLGHVFNRQYNEILPIDRFYLGGANTIRGYDRDYCPPLGVLTTPIYAPDVGLPPAADNLWRYVPQGGRTMFNCNFELRFPIYYEFAGAVFLDTGVLIKDSVQDVPNNFLGGAGFGFRYNTPIGPIRFDIAFKLDRKHPEFEAPYVWYLTLGQAF